MKSVIDSLIELSFFVFLGILLAFPLAALVQEAGGLRSFMSWMLIVISTVGAGVFAYSLMRGSKSAIRRIGFTIGMALMALLISGKIAVHLNELRQVECENPVGVVARYSCN
ncbi:hypothetical protein GSG79_004249 [Escherichia coli]|jgi:hypothetical protein|nr:hypothetical protein [Escherichia coli]EGN2600666.1 hypothetical protein [Salmonella enterica]